MNKKIIRNSLACLSAATLLTLTSTSSAVVLFSTFEDFANFNSFDNSTAGATGTQSNVDLDANTTNGLAGPNPGATGTPGSLLINLGSGTSPDGPNQFFDFMQSPNLVSNTAVVNLLVTSTALMIDYTVPVGRTNVNDSADFTVGFFINYGGGSNFLFQNVDGVTTTGVGFNTVTADFTSAAAAIVAQQNTADGLGYLFIGVTLNGQQVNGQLNIDNFQAVPEPSTYAMLGLGALGLFAVVRKRRQSAI